VVFVSHTSDGMWQDASVPQEGRVLRIFSPFKVARIDDGGCHMMGWSNEMGTL